MQLQVQRMQRDVRQRGAVAGAPQEPSQCGEQQQQFRQPAPDADSVHGEDDQVF